MTLEQSSILSIIALVLILFIWGRWRYDLVALFALFACVILGFVPEEKIFSGFGHPATITVAIVLIVSYGLTKSGAVEGVVKLISPFASVPSLHIAVLIVIAAILSMFMNNVGALALLMPIAIQSTIKAGKSPATVLMPLSFGSILGGLGTLIGTPPNIIISSYRQKTTGQAFEMFDFSPVGVTVAMVGIIFMATIGWRLIKVRKTNAGTDIFDIAGYLFEVKITDKSIFFGKTIRDLEEILEKEDNISLVSLVHKKQKYASPPKKHEFIASDIILLEGPQNEIDKFVSKNKLSFVSAENQRDAILNSKDSAIMEAVITPDSQIVGKTVEQIKFSKRFDVNVIAVSRQGESHRKRLKQFRFTSGDVMILHGDKEDIEEAISRLNCYPLAERHIDMGKRKMAMPSLAIFIGMIALAAFGVISIQIALGIAAIAMVALNIIPTRELYNGIDWPVIVLLGAMIPVGEALETTGTTNILADNLISLSGGTSVTVILALLLVITMTLSDVLNNAATAIIMAPIAKSIADALGANIDPFLMAVAIGASCAFLTPIGHQNNALVLGPGGYKFGDYWKIGLPLEIIIAIVAIPMIMFVWPFYP